MEELGECQDADDAADSEHGQDGDVQIAHGLHHIVVFSEDDQDEAARDARQNHGAYGDCTADEDEPEPVRSIRGRHCADDYAESDTYNKEEIVEKFPAFDVSNHIDCRGYDKNEEKGPGLDRIIGHHIYHQLRQCEYAQEDADHQCDEEAAVDSAPELPEFTLEEEFPDRNVHQRVHGFDDFGKNAGQQCYRAAGYARNNIGRSHRIALYSGDDVSAYVSHYCIVSKKSTMALNASFWDTPPAGGFSNTMSKQLLPIFVLPILNLAGEQAAMNTAGNESLSINEMKSSSQDCLSCIILSLEGLPHQFRSFFRIVLLRLVI